MNLLGNLIEISSTSIETYPGDDSGDSIVATLKSTGEKGETAQVYGMPGFVANPAKTTKGLRIRIGSLDIIIGGFNYSAGIPANQGETKIYSMDVDGNEAGKHYLDNDGVHTFNDGTDYAVAYEDLKSAFDELKTDFNNLVTKYNTDMTAIAEGATAAIAASGLWLTPLTIGGGVSSTADMSGAKVEDVKLP